MSDDRKIAESAEASQPPIGRPWTMLVHDELVQAAENWSGPVVFRFERHDSGHVEMHLRSLYLHGLIQTIRGMCIDERPWTEIDAKLVELGELVYPTTKEEQ